jgi:formylglycine-generating enzyme required for sulfatase activity
MNYVEGVSLKELLAGGRTLPEAEIRLLLDPLLDGLAVVHEAGYLHRDLKPANIYIRTADRRPVILDFGAAREALGRETQTLSSIVTPGYSPPEQYGRGVKQKESADIYALAATLYRCVTGETPPEAPDRVSAMVMGQDDPLLPAAEAGRGKYAPALLAAIDRALSIRENERPQSIAAFRALLRGAAPAPRPEPQPARPARTRAAEDTLVAGSAGGAEREAEPARPRAVPAPASAPGRARAPRWAFALGAVGFALAGAAIAYVALQPGERGTANTGAIADTADARKAEQDAARRQREEAERAEAERKRREAAREPRPGVVFRDCPACPEMVRLAPGSFVMGSPEGVGFARERPAHTVTLAKPFAMGKYEVTFAEFDDCVKDQGCPQRPDDRGWGRGRQPVIFVSWHDAKAYAEWLARKTGKGYRLPTEAEWEYAARALTQTRYAWGDSIGHNQANCDGCGSKWDRRQPAPVGSFAANAFGLHDMHGNVAEWTEDCWYIDHGGAPTDGTARLRGNCNWRVVRGGSWHQDADSLMRSASRIYEIQATQSFYLGFRVVRSD